jgi:hypothetical protein
VHLEEAALSETHLEGAWLDTAYLRGVFGRGAHLEHARLDDAHLEEAMLPEAHLEAARLITARLQGANLNEVDWSQVRMLGEERGARHPDRALLPPLPAAILTLPRLVQFEYAVPAYRQLATALRAQSVSEWADHFAYRGHMLQRQVLRRRHQYLRYFGSLLLDLISGYGYRPMRSFLTYALVILAFAGLYLLNSQFVAPHLTWDETLVLSMSSFHGRGFFNTGIALGDTYARLAAVEAFAGLFIEITFIATFTQRFFSR